MPNKQENAYKLRILKISTVAIALVVVVEVTVGLIVNSLAILSDGLHALLDTVTSLLLFYATKAALKPPDEEHMYGHEKFETIGGLIGGIALIGVTLLVIYEAIFRIVRGVGINLGFELAGFLAVGFTFSMDFLRFAIFRSAGKMESATVKVGFYHAIADLSSTVIAFIGFGLASLARIYWGDALASIILGVLLGFLSVKLVRDSISELSDASSKDAALKIAREIRSEPSVQKVLNLKTRKAGAKAFIETTVQVSNSLSLEEAHSLASRIEARLAGSLGTVETTIHIEPSEQEKGLEKLVEKLAMVQDVREVHEISTVYAGGKLYITLHAYVDPSLSLQQGHAIATAIEDRMRKGVKQLENVTVHIEPFGEQVLSGICEKDLKEIVNSVKPNLQVKRIISYLAQGKRFISIDIEFNEQVTVAEAHEVASKIESEIKERCADIVATVHMEPCTVSE